MKIETSFNGTLSSNNPASNSKPKPHINLSIQEFFHDGERIQDSFIVKPHDMLILKTERIKLQNNQIGFIFDKRIHIEKGLVSFSSGVIHPGFDEHVYIPVINFSKKEIGLRKGDQVFQVIIFNNDDEIGDFQTTLAKDRTCNFDEKMMKLSSTYPKSFLDIKSVEKKIENQINSHVGLNTRILNYIIILLTVVMFGLGLMNIFFTYPAVSFYNQYQELDERLDKNIEIRNKINKSTPRH